MDYPKIIKNHTKIILTRKKNGKKVTILDTSDSSNRVTGKVVAGLPITECVDDALDSFIFTVKAYDRELFEEFDVVEFSVTNNGKTYTKQMVAASDVSSIYQKHLTPPTYQHTVTVVESTKILEKFKIHSLYLSNTQDTLLRQAEKAINNAVTLIKGATYEDKCIFSLSGSLISLLKDKPSEDFPFSNTDLRTVMDGILQSNNCRCAVENISFDSTGEISKIVIGYRSLSAVHEVEPIWTKEKHGAIVFEELKNSAQDYAGKLYSKGINTICKNALTVTDTFKSGSSTISTNNVRAMLPFPISEKGFKSFIIHTSMGLPVDITQRLIRIEEYELLTENEGDFNKANCIPYSVGDSSIGFLASKTWGFLWFNFDNIRNTIKQCFKEQHNIQSEEWIEQVGNNFYYYPFTCTYYPQITTYSEVTKPGVYEKDRLRMGIWANQTENNLDMERHGKHLLSLIRRTGNGEQYIDVDADYFTNLLPLMSKIKGTGYVVYKREIAVYDMTCKCRYYLSKDFNAVQTKSGVNRVKHLYDIPLESDECPLSIKQYMIFSKDKPGNFDTTFNAGFIANALKTAIGQADGGEKVNYLLFQSLGGDGRLYPQNTENSKGETPHGDQNNRFMRPCVTYGQGKTLNFIANTLDNYSVDYSRDGYVFSIWGDGGNRMTYNRYVSKEQDSVGECNAFLVEYAYSCDVLDNPTEHQTEYNGFVDGLPVTNKTKYECATTQPFQINYIKDRTQRPVFFTSVECMPSERYFNDIIIGTAFCRDNFLVGGGKKTLNIYALYNGEKFYDSDDTIDGKKTGQYLFSEGREDGGMKAYFSIQAEEDSNSMILKFNESYANQYDNGKITAWAIVNEKKEILIAVNGQLCDIYVALYSYPPYNRYTSDMEKCSVEFSDVLSKDFSYTKDINSISVFTVQFSNVYGKAFDYTQPTDFSYPPGVVTVQFDDQYTINYNSRVEIEL